MNKVIFFLFFSTFLVAQDLTFKIEKSELFTDEYKDSKIILVEKANEKDIADRNNGSTWLGTPTCLCAAWRGGRLGLSRGGPFG